MSATTTPTVAPSLPLLGASREVVIPRDGDRDLGFKGWRLSQVKDCQQVQSGFDRCTEVSVYLTEAKKLVTHVRRWNERGGKVEREEHVVGVHGVGRDKMGRLYTLPDAVTQAIEWLKKDNGNQLGTLSKRAWLEACRLCSELKGQETERID